MAATVSLPVLPSAGPWRLTPTDVTQFVRQEQCERFLRFRMAERAGQDFMDAYGVTAQRITPLLSLSGRDFEQATEEALAAGFRTVHYASLAGGSHNRPHNNAEVAAQARDLKPGECILLFQPRLEAVLCGWLLRGDVDLLRLERRADGTLDVLIGDMKSTAEVKVEHRLQVAFYRLMLEAALKAASVSHGSVQMGVLFRAPAEPTDEELVENEPFQEAASRLFGLDDALLEVVADPEAYLQSAHDLVLGADSTARRVAQVGFEKLPYCLSFKCDGCLYNEFCMKWSAEEEDLALLPYMTGTEKEALRRLGIDTVRSLAGLKEFAAAGKPDLTPAPGREAQVKRAAATWPVGPRLDELVHRARNFRRTVKKDGTQALGYIPGKGVSTLPSSTPDVNPNLVRIYLDAQHDYLEGRVYLLGALVVACEGGSPVGRRSVVRLASVPPDSAAKERQLFVDWTRDVVKAVTDLAVSDAPAGEKKSAPIHVIFYDRYEQRLMLEALARNFPPIIEATPPLYDFLTQLAAFDSPIASFLDEEIRSSKNFPMTCQSLQSVATYLKFDWTTPHDFRQRFKARMFDYLGKLDVDGATEWYTKRSRFSSAVPMEYAYAAWGQLPPPEAGRGDEFSDFRTTTADFLRAFEARRLEAMAHVADSIQGDPNARKTSFVLPDLAGYEDMARSLAHALHEFVTIERLVSLNDWKAIRHAPPERRVLMGETLLVRYYEADQEPGVAEQNRENERRRMKREEHVAAFRVAHPDRPLRLPRDQVAECKWSPEGLRVRLRIETVGVDCDLHEALLLSGLREGDRLVLHPRWAVDERLPAAQRSEYTPTPKQLLYAPRAELLGVVATARNESGKVLAAYAEVELKESFGGEWSRGFVFGAINRTLEEGRLYTLDPCPNDWYGFWCSQVIEGLRLGQPNTVYSRLVKAPLPVDAGGRAGQLMFQAGLDAFEAAGHMHGFETGKRQFIGGHGRTPILMVQGPPGTGKSYSTGFAVFARLQAAMKEGRPLRVFVSCKTHAATDVLLKNVLDVRERLRALQAKSPGLFGQYFDPRLLDVPLLRVAPADPPPEGVVGLRKDAEKDRDEDYNADLIAGPTWCVVGLTPGGIYGMLKAKWPKQLAGHDLCDLLVLDEASQMNLPEAVMAALPLRPDGQLIVVGDHRQMPPIVNHDWDAEGRRTFRQYQVYASLFDSLREKDPPMIRFAESFRLHAAIAEFLRREVYRHDSIPFHSRRTDVLPSVPVEDELVAAALHPDYPLIVLIHDESSSQVRNPFEQALITPILRTLANPAYFGLDCETGIGVVVPHRAQRAALQQAFPELILLDPASGLPKRSAIDTVERFQGGERTVVLVSATESDRGYLLASSEFLLDPRRLTVALSRAKRKMILVASQTIFEMFSPDEEIFQNSLLWKNLLQRTCTSCLWRGQFDGKMVTVWGGQDSGRSGIASGFSKSSP
jgi:hypothetical protein